MKFRPRSNLAGRLFTASQVLKAAPYGHTSSATAKRRSRGHWRFPDLRGYGYTEKPRSGYDKRTMAADVLELVKLLGHDRAAVIGHDRGARVALRLAKDHPEFVERMAVLDNVPTKVVFDTMDGTLARGQ